MKYYSAQNWGLGGLLLLLLSSPTHSATTVMLPDTSAYSYWVQAAAGTIATPPANVQGHSKITLPTQASSGTLFVLDHHDGEIAALPLTGQNLTLSVNDFKPITAPTPAAAPAAPSASPAAKPAAAAPAPENGGLRLLTLVFGLIVACGVGWVIWRLIDSRGQPLIDAARRMGVDVPDPTAPLDADAAEPVYKPPVFRPVEKIPEEAGTAPPPNAALPRQTSVGTPDAPQIVGIQGLAAGTTFAVPVGDLSIGRDGDNGIVLAETTVSRLHAKLSRDGSGRIRLADAGSANGVYVNGSRITETTLAPGDQIQIGDNYFRFEA